jgi:hypothetical protein
MFLIIAINAVFVSAVVLGSVGLLARSIAASEYAPNTRLAYLRLRPKKADRRHPILQTA